MLSWSKLEFPGGEGASGFDDRKSCLLGLITSEDPGTGHALIWISLKRCAEVPQGLGEQPIEANKADLAGAGVG